ncbi:hypothetical protein [Pseudodesulfovibrio sp. zrk46]|uniref:hypothetical protein n=1 Tax=Pseudodesulfovibrio sp. zrk46 TaxID=2725288 RepID=UPI0014490FB0|nr:hypothetical protein [Pseudodesulfovibrio sp. zrk46]QJB55621.1 hypothetical protein HFN16_04065 [Pseudodesulfovibrio sp. zrk46]
MSADQFEFFLTEARAGWLESRIVHNSSHYDLSVNRNFSDPIKDLFCCMCDLYGADAASWPGNRYRHTEFEWGGEGWLYSWLMEPTPDNKIAVKVAFKGKREVGGPEHQVWDIEAVTHWRPLASQIFNQAAELLWMYGFSGYYDRWGKDFPAGHMMRLGHLLHDQPMDLDDFARELGYLAETR